MSSFRSSYRDLSKLIRKRTLTGGSVTTERIRQRRTFHLKFDPNKFKLKKKELVEPDWHNLTQTEIDEEGISFY
jgi:hypothetical protein